VAIGSIWMEKEPKSIRSENVSTKNNHKRIVGTLSQSKGKYTKISCSDPANKVSLDPIVASGSKTKRANRSSFSQSVNSMTKEESSSKRGKNT